MNNRLFLSLALLVVSAACNTQQDYVIKTKVPARPAGQMDMLQFAADPIPDVGIGAVGLGSRGSHSVRKLTQVPGCHIAAVCDIEQDRTESSLADLAKLGIEAKGYSGDEKSYEALCQDPSVDLVYICTDWLHHVPVALYAMEHGKHVAIEVPSAMTLQDCWDLVNTSERTRKHCLILENCCYDFFELTALEMARQGVFGEVIHAEGAYLHYLGPFWDGYWHNWRLEYNSKYRGDVYPTHGLGPVCQALNIHRGDRLTTLMAMDTDPFNGPRDAKKAGMEAGPFANGDVTMTLLRTAKGKTILIEHDVLTPRPYNRMYQLVGTEGYIGKYPVRQVCLQEEPSGEGVDYEDLGREKVYEGEELDALMAKYPSPIITPELKEMAKRSGGHGGMDFIMRYRMVYCLNHGLPLDMDVYDLAEWCCVIELSRISLEHGGMPVEVPDFTRGAWDRIQGFSYAFAE